MSGDAVASAQEHEARIIERCGWAVRGVFGAEDGSTPEFAYTVGLHLRGLPELIIFGLQYLVAGSILNALADQMLRDGVKDERLLEGPRALPGCPARLFALSGVAGMLVDEASVVLRHSDGRAAVLQVCWSDEMGRFPWAAGFNEQLADLQPLFGHAPGAAH